MTEDFLRLVSQANPAARQQYQPANNGYPPTAPYADRSSTLVDPFFDDEEDHMPDSAFGHSTPVRSQENGPSSSRFSVDPSEALPQRWNFDDDDFITGNSQTFGATSNLSKPQPKPKTALSRLKSQRWKWPWQKEQVLTGERLIALNNGEANNAFCSNFVSTSKYNLLTFLPKFLFGASFHS